MCFEEKSGDMEAINIDQNSFPFTPIQNLIKSWGKKRKEKKRRKKKQQIKLKSIAAISGGVIDVMLTVYWIVLPMEVSFLTISMEFPHTLITIIWFEYWLSP